MAIRIMRRAMYSKSKYGETCQQPSQKENALIPYPHYPADEVAARSEAIYEQQIRPKVEAEHKGKFLVIDIETGDYEIDDDDLVVTKRALEKRPEAVLYGLRIGYPTAYRLGGRFTVPQR
jgi:hypothetical protein